MTLEEKLAEIYKNAERGLYCGEYITILVKVIQTAISQRDRMTYNNLTDEERALFFADEILNKLDNELLELLK